MENAILERAVEITFMSGVIFALVAAFRYLLGRWLSPQMRYLLWFLVLLRLVVPVTWDSGLHLITLPEETPVAVAAASSPQPVTGMQADGAPRLDGGAGTLPAGAADTAMPVQTPIGTKPREPLTLRQWLLIAWGAGALLVLSAHAAMTLRLNGRIRAQGRSAGHATRRLFARVRELLDIRRDLPLVLLPDITSPALTAQLCPKLLLPDDLIGDGTREVKTFSLVHELMHYKRGDHLVCLLLTWLRVIWWFNSVVWILPLLLRTDMESACDAQVVRKMDKRQKLLYANLLLELGQGE